MRLAGQYKDDSTAHLPHRTFILNRQHSTNTSRSTVNKSHGTTLLYLTCSSSRELTQHVRKVGKCFVQLHYPRRTLFLWNPVIPWPSRASTKTHLNHTMNLH